MKIAIYTPYLDTAGGGEKYFLTIAEFLSQKEQVDLLLDQHSSALDIGKIKDLNEQRHGLDLSRVRFIKSPLGIGGNFWKRLSFLFQYDWFFYLTDGSIFLPTARHNIIHFQVPFTNTDNKNLKKIINQRFWEKAIYNSFFTKEIVEKSWNFKGEVIYPPVSIENFTPLSKKSQIVSVGRFQASLKSKKHELMIDMFKQLFSQKTKELKSWSLHLAGGVGEGDLDYLGQLKSMSEGFPIYFYPNISLKKLTELYGQSSIYWHAKGYGSNDPKDFEHFGITTVEAMAAGCVPVVINKGGQKEIVENGKSGLLWDHLEQFKNQTVNIVNSPKLRNLLAQNAVKRSQLFSIIVFEEHIKQLIYGNK